MDLNYDGVRGPGGKLARLEVPRASNGVGALSLPPATGTCASTMWWLNAGVAPVYAPYILALRIRDAVIRTDADGRKWLPGDAVYESSVYVPETLKPGNYRLGLALLDPRTGKPAIALAVQGRQPDGWYDLGAI